MRPCRAWRMINDKKCDIIWGVAGNAGNGACEAALETGKAWFIGVDSDQELTLSSDMLSSLVFGFAQALGIKFSAIGLDSNLASPIPYAVTIIGLVIFALSRRSRDKKQRLTAKK